MAWLAGKENQEDAKDQEDRLAKAYPEPLALILP